jgi:hypothetical protein
VVGDVSHLQEVSFDPKAQTTPTQELPSIHVRFHHGGCWGPRSQRYGAFRFVMIVKGCPQFLLSIFFDKTIDEPAMDNNLGVTMVTIIYIHFMINI